MQHLSNFITGITVFSLKRPRLMLSIILVSVIVLCLELRFLSFDTSGESFLKADDPARVAYLDFENRYGLSAYFIIFIEDANLFAPAKITAIENIEKKILSSVPNVASVESIVSASVIDSDEHSIVVSRLFPEEEKNIDYATKKRQALSMPYYLNRLVNKEGDATAIIVRLSQYAVNTKGQRSRLNVANVQETLDALNKELAGFSTAFSNPVLIGGTPAVTAELTAATKHEMFIFSIAGILVVGVSLFLLFKNIYCALLPLLSLITTVAVVMSLMALTRTPVHITGSIIPSFLLAICVGDAVHFIKLYQLYSADSNSPKESAIKAIQHSGVAMFFTSLTTFIGLLSFSFSHVEPVSSFGLYASIGVWVALFFTLTILPCFFVVFAVSPSPIRIDKSIVSFSKMLSLYLHFLSRNAKTIVFSAVFVFFISLYFAMQLSFSYNPMSWFKEENPVKQASNKIEQKLSGIMQVELLITRKDSPDKPVLLTDMQSIDSWLTALKAKGIHNIPIQAESSIFQFLKEINYAFDKKSGYTLPSSQEALAQEMLLLRFDAHDTVNSLINEQSTELRITLSIPWQDSLIYNQFVISLEKSFSQELGKDLQLEITGMATIGNKAFGDMISSMTLSYLQAMISVMICLAVLFRSAKLSLLMLMPNILPVVMVLGLMQIFSIPLDLFTLLIGCVAFGLVVDDTIHFVQAFQCYFSQLGSVNDALFHTLKTTGSAMVTTTMVMACGFLIYGLSSLNNLIAFGFLTAITVFLALIADLLLAPAILILFYPANHSRIWPSNNNK